MAFWPSSLATSADLYTAVNSLQTTLAVALGTGDTTVQLASATGFPTAGAVVIGNEVIFYTNISGASLTGCTRGADGTTAATHSVGVPVGAAIVAWHHNGLMAEIVAMESWLDTHLGKGTNVLAAEFEYLDGVTSAIQTQLDAKAATNLSNVASVSVDVPMNSHKFTGLAAGTTNGDSIRYEQLFGAFLPLAGGTMSGNIAMGTNKLTGLAAGTTNGDSLRYEQLIGVYLPLAGGTMSGNIDFNGNAVTKLASINQTFISAFRNRIINGDMQFDQRNAGTNVYTINNSSIRTLDMWSGEAPAADGVFTVAQNNGTVPTGFINSQKITVTTADASVGAAQDYDVRTAIEGNTVRDFLLGTASAKQFTVSFWVRSSVTGTYGFGLVNSAFNRSYVAQYTINSADTWEFKTVSLTGDTTGTWLTNTGVGLRLTFDMGSGSNLEGTANAWQAGNFIRASGNAKLISTLSATWYITGLQVEIGGTASEFERLPDGVALSRLQRYIEKSYPMDQAIGANTNDGIFPLSFMKVNTNAMESTIIPYKVVKRAAPTITFYLNTGTSGSWTFKTTAGGSNTRAVSTNASHRAGFSLQQNVAEEFLGQGHWYSTSEL